MRREVAVTASGRGLVLSARLRPHATFPDSSARLIIELLRAGRPVRFRARGGSMWPAIPGGSLIEVTPCAGRVPGAGELCAFERDGSVVVHRVVQETPDGLELRGDALARSDDEVPRADVLGHARVIERRALRLRLPRAHDAQLAARALWRSLKARLGRYQLGAGKPRSGLANR